LTSCTVGVDRLERLRVHARQEAEHLFDRPQRLHLLQRDEKVREVHPLLRARLSLESLRCLGIHGRGRLHGDRPDRTLAHALRKALRDLEAHVGLEQVAPDVAQRRGHVLLRKHSPTGEALQSGGQPLGEGRKHKPTKLLSELGESKWGINALRG